MSDVYDAGDHDVAADHDTYGHQAEHDAAHNELDHAHADTHNVDYHHHGHEELDTPSGLHYSEGDDTSFGEHDTSADTDHAEQDAEHDGGQEFGDFQSFLEHDSHLTELLHGHSPAGMGHASTPHGVGSLHSA